GIARIARCGAASRGLGSRHGAGRAGAGAIFIKWIAVIFLPLRALEARAQGRRVGHLGFAAAALAVVVAASIQFGWHWLGAFGPLARDANKETGVPPPPRAKEAGGPPRRALGPP